MILILGTTLLVRYELKSPHWEVEGQLVEAFKKWSSVPTCLLAFCAAFSKLVIILCLKFQMIRYLLGWKVELISFPSMYITCTMERDRLI
jgi:hypothetical protein